MRFVSNVLDLKGLTCPLPVLKTNKAINDAPAGATIEVHVTDSSSPEDFEVLCAATGAQLVDIARNPGYYAFTIRKAA